MLIDRARSQLLLVDMQQRMMPAIPDAAAILAGCVGLATAAQRIGVPVAALEQYPKGLGALVPELRALLPEDAIAVKVRVSITEKLSTSMIETRPSRARAERLGTIDAPAHLRRKAL
jgi:nicotinamidase-related amidase